MSFCSWKTNAGFLLLSDKSYVSVCYMKAVSIDLKSDGNPNALCKFYMNWINVLTLYFSVIFSLHFFWWNEWGGGDVTAFYPVNEIMCT